MSQSNRSSNHNRQRLRVFDLSTPWFWLVIFYWGKRYGDTWAEVNLFDGHMWGRRWWVHIWQWEDEPDRRGALAEADVREFKGK